MITRSARIQDLQELVRMVRNFQQHSPLPELRSLTDSSYVEQVLLHIIVGGGVCVVAEHPEHPNKLVGMLIGVKTPSVWHPPFVTLAEIAFWVDEEHRNTTAGYRLIRDYIDACVILQRTKQIQRFTMCKMTNSPDLKYEKLGFRYIEQTWTYEGKQ